MKHIVPPGCVLQGGGMEESSTGQLRGKLNASKGAMGAVGYLESHIVG